MPASAVTLIAILSSLRVFILKYRAEIDGLRALAVAPVILFHAGFDLFSGGYIGVDVFFVISGYLITTILIEDIENKRFSIASFYERRARRILPVLFLVCFATTAAGYFFLFPTDFTEFSKSLLSVLLFSSNIFFWKNSDYFARDAELTPLIHTWSLAVEEQYYVLFPLFLFLTWRFGKNRVFWMIVLFSVISLALSEWASHHTSGVANFYLAPTRVWELLAGSIAAFIAHRHKIKANNVLSSLGLATILFTVFVYDESIRFPSLYTLAPVLGALLIILFAEKDTIVARALSTKTLVGLGLISYSAYLWHQPLLVFTRKYVGENLQIEISLALIACTIILSVLSWRYVETPFRKKSYGSTKAIFGASAVTVILLSSFAIFVIISDGAAYRFSDFPKKPTPWANIKCHGAKSIIAYPDPLQECLGGPGNRKGGDFYLIGDSHAAQISFALRRLAEARESDFFFINTENPDDYPYSFRYQEISNDRLLDYVLKNADSGDMFMTSFHRGQLNKSRDTHLKITENIELNQKAKYFYINLLKYMKKFDEKEIRVFLIEDGPLLSEIDTSLESCMYRHKLGKNNICKISIFQDIHTRKRQSLVFEKISKEFPDTTVIDYLPALYQNKEYFSPISNDGEYLMFDRHHLTEKASLMIIPLLDEALQ